MDDEALFLFVRLLATSLLVKQSIISLDPTPETVGGFEFFMLGSLSASVHLWDI